VNRFQAIAECLSARKEPVKVFFRDDDGGWADDRLQSLADGFIELDLPLDIAVIPEAMSGQSVEVVNALLDASDKISIHQHGFAHTNHQVSGRSCEFGSDRNYEQQFQDIAAGQEQLTVLFGSHAGSQLVPVFTPPWNRCTNDTVAALKAVNVQYLSRITGSAPIETSLPELPVTVDWLKKSNGERLTEVELIEYICHLLDSDEETFGIMLHHEHMDQQNRELLHRFIEVLNDSSSVSFHSMMDAAAGCTG